MYVRIPATASINYIAPNMYMQHAQYSGGPAILAGGVSPSPSPAGTEEEEGEAEDESEEAQRRKKPWGDSSHYCPVALKEMGVLWPGKPRIVTTPLVCLCIDLSLICWHNFLE